jgi:predicted DNA-binding transcriptional regulator YafY
VLRAVADAVWGEQRIAVTYESWTSTRDRVLEPLGLVLKSGGWYLVALSGGQARTFRLDMIKALRVTEERFARPAGFDLASYWVQSTAQFEKDIYVGIAEVRASPLGVMRLKDLNAAVRGAIEADAGAADADGWRRLFIPIEEVTWTRRLLIRIGAEIEVIGPPELRAAMAAETAKMAALYAT